MVSFRYGMLTREYLLGPSGTPRSERGRWVAGNSSFCKEHFGPTRAPRYGLFICGLRNVVCSSVNGQCGFVAGNQSVTA